MKTIRLTKLESAAYTAGERRFWRALSHNLQPLDWEAIKKTGGTVTSPYGKPGDRIEIIAHGVTWDNQHRITAITVEQRGGRWGWAIQL
jgi:hypothetical protein